MINVLMAASEALPFSKTGGLADVVYSLSKEYVKLDGVNVSVITPLYASIDLSKYKGAKKVDTLEVKMNWRKIHCDIYKVVQSKISYYLVDNKYYFSRDKLYGYYDDGERFAFFTHAVIQFLKESDESFDIVHCHDWQVGMIPCLLKVNYWNDEKLSKIKTVFTIHNPLFKGYFAPGSLYDLYELDSRLYNNGDVRLDNQVSTLKAGIKFADKITTVSPTHAYELTTVDGSFGLWYDLTLRKNDFVGILNGVDVDEFNPRKDKMIYKQYGIQTIGDKEANKVAFCNEHGLDPELPLYAVVSRLTDQKGLDLIFAMSDFLTGAGGNFAVLGSGESFAENFFNELYARNPSHTSVYIGYNNDLAHKLYASSDFFIMPSKFEPCGIGQMIAHRYGSIPIVRATGGLKDSVIGYKKGDGAIDNSNVANGFSFEQYSTAEAVKTVGETLTIYNRDKKLINKLALNSMRCDHTRKKSALEYLDLYSSILI